jgi:hypothetical protein
MDEGRAIVVTGWTCQDGDRKAIDNPEFREAIKQANALD